MESLFSCDCGWQGASEELKENSSLIHADAWYECPKCSCDASNMKIAKKECIQTELTNKLNHI